MRLSMWVVTEWLPFDGLRADIQEGNRELRNARLLPSSGELSRSTVYLDSDESGNVLCTCGKDFIVVPGVDVDTVLTSILDCFEHYNDLDARLRDLVATGAGLDALLNEAGCTLGRFFVVADATYYIHGAGGDVSQLGDNEEALESLRSKSMPLAAIMHVNKQQGIRTRGRETYEVDVKPLGAYALATNLFSGNRHDGWLVSIRIKAPFTRGDMHVQDGVSAIVLQWMRMRADDELRTDRSAVLADLLKNGPESRETADVRLASLGWGRDDPKCIYAVRQYDPSKNPSHVIGRFLERIDPTLVVTEGEGGTVLFADLLLVQEGQLESAMAPLLAMCGCVAGKGMRFTDTGEASSHLRTAREAAERADARNPIKGFGEIKLDYALSVLRSDSVADVRHDALDLLVAYDEQHATNLVETLRAYLSCACSATAAAEALFVHRSTLLYRLDRIAEIGNVDLSDPDTRFHLDLSLRINDI